MVKVYRSVRQYIERRFRRWLMHREQRRGTEDKRYPEFKNGLGHGLGRAVYDGGTLLGPRWPCYGRNTEAVVEGANVFTLELGVPTSAGLVGLEEDVLVTAAGCEFLLSRQRELVLV